MPQPFQLIQEPVYQALLFLLLTCVVALVAKAKTADTIWVIAGLNYGAFLLTNSILVFFSTTVWYYFFSSVGLSFLYLIVIALVIKLLASLRKLEGSEESAMIFLVIIFHPFLLLMAIFLKWVVAKVF